MKNERGSPGLMRANRECKDASQQAEEVNQREREKTPTTPKHTLLNFKIREIILKRQTVLHSSAMYLTVAFIMNYLYKYF